MTGTILGRIIIAVLFVVVLFALLPPLFRLFGLPDSADLLFVLRICIGGLAAYYVVKGSPAL